MGEGIEEEGERRERAKTERVEGKERGSCLHGCCKLNGECIKGSAYTVGGAGDHAMVVCSCSMVTPGSLSCSQAHNA